MPNLSVAGTWRGDVTGVEEGSGRGEERRGVPLSDTIKAFVSQKKSEGRTFAKKKSETHGPGAAWCVRGFSFGVDRALQLRAINIHEDEPAP